MKKIRIFIIVLMVLILTGCSDNNVDFSKTNIVTFNDLTVEIPNAFTKDTDNGTDEMVFYSYSDAEKYNYCSMYLAISNYPDSDMKKAIQEGGFYNKTDWTYNEKDINGYKWSIGYKEESVKHNKTFYVINHNGKEYSFNYEDYGSGDKCAEALKVIEKTLKFN